MLYNPRWMHTTVPTFQGFVDFVADKAADDPDGSYNYPQARRCAVGQYLTEIGIHHCGDWHEQVVGSGPINRLLADLDATASGPYFTGGRRKASWTWAKLHRRLQRKERNRAITADVED